MPPSGYHSTPDLWEKLKPLAREMRHTPTQAEEYLWSYLRNRRLSGMKFRRQVAIDRFIVDFFCAAARLIVEVGGPIHAYTPEEDAVRQEFLEAQGLTVLRFTNVQVLTETQGVLATLREYLAKPHP